MSDYSSEVFYNMYLLIEGSICKEIGVVCSRYISRIPVPHTHVLECMCW